MNGTTTMTQPTKTYVFVDDGYPEACEFATNYLAQETSKKPSKTQVLPRSSEPTPWIERVPGQVENAFQRVSRFLRSRRLKLGFSAGRAQ
jgi:hypothetical protein